MPGNWVCALVSFATDDRHLHCVNECNISIAVCYISAYFQVQQAKHICSQESTMTTSTRTRSLRSKRGSISI